MLVLWLCFAPFALGQQASPLGQVPADAPIVIHVRGLERTKDRIVALAKNAVPDMGEMLKAKLDEAIQQGLQGRKIEGLPKDGSILMVFTEMPKPDQDEPAAAAIFAVSDYKAFRDGYLTADEKKTLKEDKAGFESVTVRGRDVFLVNRKGYAVVTVQKDVAAKLAGKYDPIEAKLPKDTAKKLLESDAAVYVDMAAVNKEFGDQIKAFRPLLDFIMQQAEAQTDKAQIEMAKAMINGIFQFMEDSRGFLASVEFRPEGLALHVQGRVGADTKVNSFLKTARTSSLADIGKLPAGKMTYMAAVVNEELVKVFGPILQGMMPGGTEEAKPIGELFNQLAAAGPSQMIAEYSMPLAGLQVWQFKDPAKATEAYAKMFQGFLKGESYSNVPLKDKPVFKKDAQTHRNFKLHSVSLQWDFEKLAERMPQGGQEMADIMKTMMGDGANIWLGTDGKVFVQVTAKDWSTAQQQLDEFLDGKNVAAKQPAFQDAMKQLPSTTTLISLIDGPLYMEAILGVIVPMIKAQGVPIELPAYKGTPGKSYFGMAMSLQPEIGGIDIWFPASMAAEIQKIVEPLMGQRALQ